MLALDAPVIALVWQHLLARPLEPSLAESMAIFFAVWAIYLADRLLDAQAFQHLGMSELPLRHQFFRQHRRGACVLLGFTIVGGLVAALFLPSTIWWKGGTLAAITGGYLIWNQAGARAPARKWAKELVVAAIFAFGCGLVSLNVIGMEKWLAGVTVLTVCAWLNCLQIATMEKTFDQRTGTPSWAVEDRFEKTIFRFLPWSLAIALAVLLWITGSSPVVVAGIVAAVMFGFTRWIANRHGSEIGGAWADAAILLPAIIGCLI